MGLREICQTFQKCNLNVWHISWGEYSIIIDTDILAKIKQMHVIAMKGQLRLLTVLSWKLRLTLSRSETDACLHGNDGLKLTVVQLCSWKLHYRRLWDLICSGHLDLLLHKLPQFKCAHQCSFPQPVDCTIKLGTISQGRLAWSDAISTTQSTWSQRIRNFIIIAPWHFNVTWFSWLIYQSNLAP